MSVIFRSIVTGIAVCAYSFAAYADSTNVVSNKTKSDTTITSTKPGIHLDQSKDILFEQFSANTFALQLLQAKNTFNNNDLIIGGSLQTDWQHWHGKSLTTTPVSIYDHGQDLYLTQATLDIMGNVSHWATTFLSIADGHIGQPFPNGNDIFINRAMVMIGDLDKFPVYTTIGINTIPFGVFAGSGVWDTPLTGSYFNPSQAPMVSIAYYNKGLNVSVSKFSDDANHQNHTVMSAYYNHTMDKFNYSLGAGYLTDLQSNDTGTITTHRKRKRDIPAGLHLGDITDVNASMGYGPLLLSGEYDRGSQKIGSNTGAPEALSFTLTYTHAIAGRDATFGISHSRSFHLVGVPTSLAGADGLPLSAEGLREAWAISAIRPFFSNNLTLGVNFEKTETYLTANSYTGTVELFLYL